MTDTIPMFVVATMSEATTVLRRLTRAGWRSGDSFALPEQQWDLSHARLVRYGRIAEADTAELALLAAARGVGVVAVADVSTDIGRALLADLERLGPVSTAADSDEPLDTAAAARLLPEQRALLDRLAAGETIAAAAAAEFLSLRTANRRIAEARGILGVRTTREAVLAYLRQRREQ